MFVFRNGISGEGPFGFQPDVFDGIPGEPRYTPLRRVKLVEWKAVGRARVLRSAEEVRAAQRRGDVVVTRPGIVVNMPMLTWPGGRR